MSTKQHAKTDSEFQFTGFHMLACMAAFFGVIVAVNITMATYASTSWTGLVVKNSYVASQKFNSELEDAKALRASGIHSRLSYSAGQLQFAVIGKDGSLLPISDLKIELGRPAFEQSDRVVTPDTVADLKYFSKLALAEGEWVLKITGNVDGMSYRRDARVFIGSDGKGVFE